MSRNKLKYFSVRKIADLRDMVKQTTELIPDSSAFTLKDSDGNFTSITYREFSESLNKFGTALIDLGLKNAKIAVMSENRYEWCLHTWPLSTRRRYCTAGQGTSVNEVSSLLSRSEASAIVTSSDYIESVIKIKDDLPDLKYIISMDPVRDGKKTGLLQYLKCSKRAKPY